MQFCHEEKALQPVDAGRWSHRESAAMPGKRKQREAGYARLPPNRRRLRECLFAGPAGGFGGEEARLGPPGQDDQSRGSDSDRDLGALILVLWQAASVEPEADHGLLQ